MNDVTELKKRVGEAAAARIESGMRVGLGTGSTAVWMVRRLGERLRDGDLTDIVGVPTSERTAQEAASLGIPLATLEDYPTLNLTIDGADEIDPQLNLVKGGGGALLREKIVAQASEQFIIVADDRKLVDRLGTTFKLPVEVVAFGHGSQLTFFEGLGAQPALRLNDDGQPFLTDSNNYIYDCTFANGITDLMATAARLSERAGIVDHGLFLGMATLAIVSTADGVAVLTSETS